jgi:hypothetical protein
MSGVVVVVVVGIGLSPALLLDGGIIYDMAICVKLKMIKITKKVILLSYNHVLYRATPLIA